MTGSFDSKLEPSQAVPLVNLANILTVVRIVLVPVFLAALFVDGGHSTGWRFAAWAIFAAAAITDRYDGRIARKRGLVTNFGKLADPIADKALIGAALIGLSLLGDLWWWVTGVILARELAITVLRFVVLRYGVIPASRGGKIKTFLQTLAIGLYIFPLESFAVTSFLAMPAVGLMMAAVLVTIVTAIDYFGQAFTLYQGSRSRMKP